ncbi:MAG: autotransporter-associated beta strand repeat-containing protein, partial [Prosthecobacter sp.]|uniref:autotransporter-associated beta strand repeat-containing protein n=1 Tax=Prosthecobacter sp. TaxID=1965333 RepID=UPI003BAFDD6D
MKKSSVLLDTLRRHFTQPIATALAVFFPFWALQVQGATLYYNGSDGQWNTTATNWSYDSSLSDTANWLNGEVAIFGGVPGTITVGGPITAGGLVFGSDGNVITGGTLTLSTVAGVSSSVINVASFKGAQIDSIIAGSSGLTKTGNGTLRLGSNANTFTGDVVINGGAVVITNQAQLGAGTTVISVNGLANTGNPGYSGGSLVLQGGIAGMTINRDISLSGRGPGAINNGGALISVGNNTIAGNLVIGGTASQGNVISTHGVTTISGDVQLGNGSTQTFFGNGNFIISGQITSFEVANDRFSKTGNSYGTTMWLQNANNNFAQSLRIDSGTVRVSTNGALGVNPSTQSVDLNNGILEVRTDTPGVGNADFSKRKIFNRDFTNTGIFVSRDVNGSAINQTVTFGETRATGTNVNFRITGRDGFNVTLLGLNNSPAGVMGTGGASNTLIENNSNGLLTLATSSLWNQTDTTARTLTIQGNADTLLTGNLTAAGAAHVVTKSGTGTLTIQGTSSNFLGSFNVNAGTVAINSFGAINSGTSGALQLSSGALNYLGAAGTGAGETVTKAINLTSTTGSGIILANQTGSSPSALIIANNIAATGAGIKNLYLGGESTLQNEIRGVIQDNTTTNKTSLVKIGSGTWLYDPSASNYVTAGATGVTTTGGGAAQSNSFTVSNAASLVVGQTVSGTNIPGGSIITAINGNTITINNTIGTAVANATALTFGTVNNFTGTVTVAGGTLQIKATAGSGSGSNVIDNGSALIFNADPLNTNQVAGGTFEYLGFSGGALTESLGALTMTAGAGTIKITAGGGATGLIFSSLATPAIGTGLNVIGDGTVTLTGVATSTATTLTGNGRIYFNGADFARSNGGVLVAPVYDTDAGFVTAGAALTAASHNLVTGNTSSAALTISSLKILGSQTVDQTGLLTINLGANTSGGILQTGGSGTISGTGVTTGGNQDLVVRVDGLTDSLLISAPITSTTTGGLTKNGAGTLILSGANAETGTVTVNEGTLQLSGTGLIGATNVNLMIRQGATFDLNGVNVGTAASGTNSVNAFNGAGIITNSAASGTATLRFSNNNTGGVFTGLIQDGATATVALVKAGSSSTVALTGASTFTGPVTILSGNLDIPNIADIGVASGIGKGDATSDATNAASLILNGGALRYVGTNSGGAVTATQTPSVSINRLFTLAGNGTIASFGSYGNLSAGRNNNNAALIFNNTADLAFSGTGARTLTLDGDSQGDNEIDIHLIDNPNGGALSLTKNGGGLWILNPSTPNIYTGTTTINGGALQAVDGAGLSSGSNLLLNGGVYQTSGTFNRAMGTGAGEFRFAAYGNGGFSSGTSKLSVDFSSLGTPVWGSTANFIGAGALILNNATSLADVEIKGNFDLAAGISKSINVTTTAGSATVNLTSGTTDGLTIGQAFTGNSNIPAGLYITAINSSTQFTLSSGTGVVAAAAIPTTVTGEGWRQIQVDDNGSTNLDFATVSGVIGGTGGLGKIGSAGLILGNANTYSGRTVIRQDAVYVTSIGASGATSSSFGTNVGGGILELGNPGSNTTVSLMYVGAGETTTREIDLTGTTGTRRIDSSGTGALILTDVRNTTGTSVNTIGGDKTLEIRGTNTDANMITSVLADNAQGLATPAFGGVGALRVLKADGGVWILNAANTYTGGTRVDGGLLGIGTTGSLGAAGPTGLTSAAVNNSSTITLATGTTAGLVVGMNINGTGIAYGDTIASITSATTFTISSARTIPVNAQLVFGGLLMSNAGIFATDPAGLTISQPVILNNNSTAVFAGANPITINGDVIKNSGGNDNTLSNNLEGGALLTINGNFLNFQNAAATRQFNIRGYGSTIWNGDIKDNALLSTSLTRLDIRIANEASFTIGSATTLTGGILLGQGTLVIGNVKALGTATNALILDGGVLTSAFDLTGVNKLVNAVTIAGDPAVINGTQSIEFGSSVTNNGSTRVLQNDLDAGSGAVLTLSGGVNLSESSTSRTMVIAGSGTTNITSAIVNGSTATASAVLFQGNALNLSGTNTFGGALTINRGTVTISGTGGSINSASGITLNAGGTLALDNSGGNNAGGRVNGRAFTFNGGALSLVGNNTSESIGVATVNSIMGTISMSGTGSNTLTFATANFANSGSSWDLSGISGLGSTNKVKITTYQQGGSTFTNAILPRIVLLDDFAAYDSTNGVVAFTAYNNTNNLNGAANGDTMNVTSSANVSLSRTLNALKINGSGLSITSTGNRVLTLTTGSLISTGGDNTLAVSQVNLGGSGGFFQVQAGTTLHVTSALINGQLSKVGAGTLSLESTSYYNSTTNVMGGTLQLNAGLNAIFPAVNSLNIGIGATVDLNGSSQYIGNLTGGGNMPSSAGSLTNTSLTTSTFVTNGGGTFGGIISGGINLGRVAGGTLTLETAQTYTGTTSLLGGTTTLENEGSLLATSAIEINGATLVATSNSSLQMQNNDRIGDGISITLRGGNIQINGRVNTMATERLGDIILAQGANSIQAATGGTGTAGAFTAMDLTIASLTRSAGSTVNFLGSTALGSVGNFPRIVFTSAPTTYGDGVLGAWAISNSNDYAAYNTTNGVGTVGNGGFAGYSAVFGSGNITDLGTYSVTPLTTTLSGSTTASMLRLTGNFTNNIAFTSGSDVLNLELGGILRTNNAFDTSFGTTAIRGVITAGGTETSGTRELIVYNTSTSNPSFTNPNSAGGIVAGSPVVIMNSTIGIQPGMTLANANFAAGTTVVSVDSLTQITLSTNATANAQNQTFTAGSFVSGTTALGSAQITMNSTTGIAPGMTLTGTGIPAGTYVVSVDSPTQVTLSQVATAAGSALTFSVGMSNLIINSVIADNGAGNKVTFVKSGTGIVNLSANNTYTGGTVVDQGTLNLIGSGVVLPAGGLTINNAAVTMLTNVGQIDASNDVTLVGSSTLTLAGGLGLNNTLKSITFNNNGGSGTPTITNQTNSILTLTSSAPITVTSSNASTVATINGGFLALGSGNNTFSIQAPTLNGQAYTQLTASLSISSAITGTGAKIIKTDNGLLQLSGQSTFDGGMLVQGGGILLSASSTSTVPNSLLSGPLGVGTVSFADGTTLLVDNNSRTVANAMSFAGSPIFNNTGTNLPTLTLNGALTFDTLATTGVVINIPTPFLNVVLGGPIANIGSITSFGGTGANTISKTGLGNITGINLNGYNTAATIDIGALNTSTSFSLLVDGDRTGSFETINLGAITWESTVTGTALSLTIGRAGTSDYYPLAVNKVVAPSSFTSSLLGNGLTVTNNNNYGLLLADNIAFNTVSSNQGPTFNVVNGSTSLQLDGLTLSGVLSGGPTGASAVVLTKSGGGVLSLTNTGNTFGGGGSIIDITAGLIAASSDAALGNAGNIIRLSGNNLGFGFRATGTFASSRTFNLNSAAGEIEVTQGNTLTLNNAFTFASANNALRKYDLGTLELTSPETGWNGVMFVQQGVLRISNGNQLGNASSTTSSTATTGASGQTVLTPTGGTANYGVGQLVFGTGIAADTFITAISGTTITLSANTTGANPTITTSAGGILMSNVGSALELTGGATVADGIFINASNNATSNGMNGGGAIRSTSGINTVSGLITIATSTADNQMRAVTLAADAGATLNISGGVLGQVGTAGSNRHSWVGIGGEGTTNITTTGFTNTGTLGIYQLNKFGTGTLNIQVANAFSGRDVMVKQGTLSLNGTGTFGTLGSGQGSARTIYVHDVGTLVLDNSGTAVNNRLGNAALSFQGSDFKIIGSGSATTTETTTGAMTLNAGASVFTLDAGASQQLNFTTAGVTRNGGSTLLIRADGFGNAAGANVATIQGSTATYTFTGQLGATGTTNKSILGWAIGDTSLSGSGVGFVTADSAAAGANAGTNRLRLLSGSEQVTSLSTAGTNVNLTSAANLAASLSINSLQIGSGGGITLSGGAVLTLESGALLVQAGNSGISGTGTLTAASNRELIVYTVGDLTLGVAITGTSGGLTKSGEGTLTLAAGNTFTGTVTINQGTLKLDGTDFSLTSNQTMQLLGGNLDLNGTVQNINNLQAQTGSLAVNDGFAPNTAGYVINTSGSQATLALTTANVSFRGAIGNGNVLQSNIAVVRSGAAGSSVDWNLYGDNTYTGATLLNGGRTQLIDGGRWSGTSSIEISNSTLLVTTGNITVESVSLTDRINDAATITLNGAMFQWRSRASLYSTEQLGEVRLGYGSSIIDFAEPGSNVNQSDVTFASFAQTVGQHGTVRFLNIDGNISALQRLFISNLNGVATTNIGDGLSNNIIGGWATFEREFATYTPSQGVGGLTNNGYAGYSPSTIFTGTATDNVRILLPVAGSTTTLTADVTLN